MIKKWTVLEEEDVSPSKWFPLLRHIVKTPHNKIIDDYYFAPLGNVVMVLAITSANEAVLVRQYKHGAGEILLELPAGAQQHNKSIEESALAELEEETGIRTTADKLISLGKIANNPTKTNHITYGFLVTNAVINSLQNLDATEDIEVVTVAANKLPGLIYSGEIWVGDSVAFIIKAMVMFPEMFK